MLIYKIYYPQLSKLIFFSAYITFAYLGGALKSIPKFHFFLFLLYFALQYSTDVHEFPILNPPPTSHSISSLWIIPVHQPQASSILYRT